LNILRNGDHPKSDPRPAQRARIFKAKPVTRLECFAETSLGSS
jgi:hypothetical protein